MPTIQKHPLKGHGTFDPASVGLFEYAGKWYYRVVSSTHEHDGPYDVGLNKERTEAISCTCKDYREYREPHGDICKHMIGINHLLELKSERLRYEQALANLQQQCRQLREEVETLRWRYEIT